MISVKINILQDMIDSSENIVFFGGAGVSTDSGIPDFRSKDGLYNQKYKYPPEYMLSAECFYSMPNEFFTFYNEKILGCLDAEPNFTHTFLVKLERCGKLRSVVTQNIDGLHQKAGTKTVRELHGTIYKNRCTHCGKFFEAKEIVGKIPPKCFCGGIIKPEVVLYGEGLNDETVSAAIEDISVCDMLIIGGTSLAVYPAAALINYYRGNKLVLINRDETPKDGVADLVIHGSLSEVFKQIRLPN